MSALTNCGKQDMLHLLVHGKQQGQRHAQPYICLLKCALCLTSCNTSGLLQCSMYHLAGMQQNEPWAFGLLCRLQTNAWSPQKEAACTNTRICCMPSEHYMLYCNRLLVHVTAYTRLQTHPYSAHQDAACKCMQGCNSSKLSAPSSSVWSKHKHKHDCECRHHRLMPVRYQDQVTLAGRLQSAALLASCCQCCTMGPPWSGQSWLQP